MGLIADLRNKSEDLPLPILLKQRFSFFSRSRSDLEREREELLARIEILTARNEALLKIAELDPHDLADELTDPELEILEFVANQMEASAGEVCDALECKPARAEYLLTRLLEKDFLVDSQLLGRHSYVANKRGRDYLEHNAVSK